MSTPTGGLKGEVVYPSPEVLAQANVKDPEAVRQLAAKDIEAYWAKRAEELDWYKKWDKVLDDSNKPFYKWFVGGKTNIVLNAIDRHVATWRRNKLALIWEGEKGDVRTFSYHALAREVCKFANALKSMGIGKGDRVTIYMPRIPETVIAMLATAKIGAVHSVVYGGFSVEALHGRIEDSESKVIVTADGGYMNGKVVELKKIVDEALKRTGAPENVVVVRHTGREVSMEAGRDYWYHDLMSMPLARNNLRCETEVMDAEDPLYILYTSGTTGKPKAILHTHGGYSVGVHATFKDVFDIKEEDRWWCTADPGWVTGHSYIVYAPLIAGATSVMYEGAPTYPFPDRWWSIVEKYGVSIMYTTPTAIRGLMRFGTAWANRHDLSSLRLLGSVGEPINPEAWRWFHKNIGKERCPIMDTWWQTETGMFMIAPMPAMPLKPGFGHQTVPRHRGGRGGRPREFREARRGGIPGAEEALARHAPDRLQGPGPVRQDLLEPISRHVHRGRLRAQGRGRLLLDHRPRRRRDQGERLPSGNGRAGVGVREPPRRGRGGGDRTAS